MAQDFEALLGPKGKGEYNVGDTIAYMHKGLRKQGTIEWIEAPGVTPVTGTPHPTEYWVSDGGVPDCIYQGDILQD